MKKRYVLKAEVKDEIIGLSMISLPILTLFIYLFTTR